MKEVLCLVEQQREFTVARWHGEAVAEVFADQREPAAIRWSAGEGDDVRQVIVPVVC